MHRFYIKENITLFHDDCIEILNKVTPESVNMIFTDPSYMLSGSRITFQSMKVVSVNKILRYFNITTFYSFVNKN